MKEVIYASNVGGRVVHTNNKPMCVKQHNMGYRMDAKTNEAYYVCKICEYSISTKNIVSYTISG